MNAGTIILILKIAVFTVTLLLLASLTALWRGNQRLHGRINYIFFVLTLVALFGLEVIVRLIDPTLFDDFLARHAARDALRIHLGFSMPAAGLLFVMLFTGVKHHRRLHIACGVLFLLLWTGTFVTGIFYLPHQQP